MFVLKKKTETERESEREKRIKKVTFSTKIDIVVLHFELLNF